MRTLHIPVSMAACLAVLFGASASFADDEENKENLQRQQSQTPAAQQPQQQPQVIVVQPPAPQGQVGTTQTTGAPYGMRSSDRFADRTVESRPNSALLGTGVGLFGLSYAPAAVIGAMSDRPEDKRLFIPVAGPFLDLADRDCRARPCGENEELHKAALITSGAVQGAGVLMALSSLFIPEEKTVQRNEAKPGVKILPVSFGSGAGIGAIGRF